VAGYEKSKSNNWKAGFYFLSWMIDELIFTIRKRLIWYLLYVYIEAEMLVKLSSNKYK